MATDTFPETAVSLQHLHVSYGYGFAKSKIEVLKDINLHVATGTIYGLLGPSGCGKTTLLKCVIGRLEPDKGLVTVFGTTPGIVNSNIPGSGVGYMPQEIALLKELTIVEALNYHGSLHHMKRKHLKARIKFLLEFLNLKEGAKYIKNLSGGQQRRVSFATALLHEPPLLILDEPTVGVDPILRENIWDHLLDLCVSGKVTVIITTHYIEEARQANKVGLMRNGRFLAEDEPTMLLNRYNLPTLEDVYLKLCREDEVPIINEVKVEGSNGIKLEMKKSLLKMKDKASSQPEVIIVPARKPVFHDYMKPPSWPRISAMVNINLIRMRRSIILLIFQFLTPVIQIGAFCMAVGADPRNIPVAVLNNDNNLGARYLQALSNDTILQIPVSSIEEGTNLVLNGKAAATIDIWQNFTPSLIHRFVSRRNTTDEIIEAGTIHLRFDTIDQQIMFYLQKAFYEGIVQFADNELTDKRFPHLITNLFEIGEPVYGSTEPFFTEFMATGILLNVVFFLAVGLTAVIFVSDKRDGLHDRNCVAGVTSFEVMLGHTLTQLIVVIFQIATVLILVIEVFNVNSRGNIVWVFLLSLLQGMCGMMYGFLISTICDDETSAMLLALGSFYPCILLSGAVWPLEAAASAVQVFCQFVPQTLAVEALRLHRPSSQMDAFSETAVSIQHVRLSYGFIKSKIDVLKDVNLNVNSGIIYGLLGPSGCGKTTLLKCVVGRKFPNFGVIKVFGKTPGLINSKIPGPGVGYMPQELALFDVLTIAETLNYFGCLHRMESKNVKSRINFLLEFLNLPSKERRIGQLSGGQQRRVSFAAAMLHEPPLLILDEPTAGVDPLLRENIWQYLTELCTTKHVTVIITTHYIEEAREANMIGLMRNGRVLVEETPSVLLERFNLQTLEEVYLKICRDDDFEDSFQKDQAGKQSLLHINNQNALQPNGQIIDQNYLTAVKPSIREYFAPLSLIRIMGLVHKNFIRMRRSITTVIFQFLLPVIAFCAFFVIVDGLPNHIPIAVLNEDFNFGSQFLMQLNNETIKQMPIKTLDEGISLVTNGDAVAVIHIWENFTYSLSQSMCCAVRTLAGPGKVSGAQSVQSARWTLCAPDKSNLSRQLYRPDTGHTHEPIYGDMTKLHVTEFFTSGLLLSILNLMAIGLTSFSLIMDKKEGLLDRSYVSGVTFIEIMCGHIITQLSVVIVQVLLILFVAFQLFNLYFKGSFWPLVLISMLQAVQGMCFGFFVATICNEVHPAMMLSLTFFLPNFLLSGTLWPIAAQPNFLQAIVPLLPQTLAIESVRWIMLRGADLLWMPVWSGVVVTVVWIMFYLILSIALMSFK
uniref:ABC transporter domain-containing protein n=1 Tax=Strigamia maritima TaxID=126957 RepID=T1IX93_STRMM